jgi:hypothetical protein
MGENVAPAKDNLGGPLFDLDFWLESTSKIQTARRRGANKLIHLEYLADELRRLHLHGVVTMEECRELLQGLVDDGLIPLADCSYFLP